MNPGAAHPVIVTIQSQLVYGCAGNNAAVPVLTTLGATVYAVPTVLFSNTPHYPTLGGQVLDATMIQEILHAFLDRVSPSDIDAIVTGYIGSAETAVIVANFIDRVRADHPGVVVLCDPVMGDQDIGHYVSESVADAVCAELVPRANILTPNHYEAQSILGKPGLDGVNCSLELLRDACTTAVVTGIVDESTNEITTIASDSDRSWCVTTKALDLRPTGTGDVFSAAFLHEFLVAKSLPRALEKGVNRVYDLLDQCRRAGAAEMAPANSARTVPRLHTARPVE